MGEFVQISIDTYNDLLKAKQHYDNKIVLVSGSRAFNKVKFTEAEAIDEAAAVNISLQEELERLERENANMLADITTVARMDVREFKRWKRKNKYLQRAARAM